MLHWPYSSCNKQCHDVLVLSSLFYLVDLFKLSINWLFTLRWRLEEFLISQCFHFLGLEFNWSPKNHIWFWVFTFVMKIMNGCRQKVFPLSSVRCLWQKSRSACCELHPFQQKARMSLLQKKNIRTTPGKSVPGSEKGLSIVVCLIVPLTHCPCTCTAISAHPGPPGHLSFTLITNQSQSASFWNLVLHLSWALAVMENYRILFVLFYNICTPYSMELRERARSTSCNQSSRLLLRRF